MIDEAKFVEDSFRRNFNLDDCIAIYGLGKNTKVIVENCPEYNIVALMDRNRTGESEWGLPILSVDEVNERAVNKIVIIATAANVPVIFRRIAKSCENYGISVYNIEGTKQEIKKEYKLDDFYLSCTEQKAKEKIDECDVVSFDIFDTLLVRKTLYPTDVFEIVGKRCGSIIPVSVSDFYKLRIECERKLYSEKQPNIYDIYNEIQRNIDIDEEVKKKLIECEVEIEKEVLFARESILDLWDYALSENKKICCTSDMYLTEKIIRELLTAAGYTGMEHVFVSCEIGKSKSSGLFEVVKKTYPGKKILHIGDNADADIRCADEQGIDDTFRISSIYKMIDDSRLSELLAFESMIEERCELGKLFSKIFNDPFLFSETDGRCVVKDNYSIGYYFIEPMLAAFIEWILSECQKEQIEMLLLGARDGFIIEKLLDVRAGYTENVIPYSYFYASRYTCTLAGVSSEDDVKYAFSMAFEGSAKEMLMDRFALNEEELLTEIPGETDEQFLERHNSIILRNAQNYRERYREYAENIIGRCKKIGFFDFVSSGTCQLWLENIFPEAKWIGYYFIKTLDKYKDKLDIRSYFMPKYVYEKQSKLYKNYIFMENIMTSYEATLKGFSSDGLPVFEDDKREKCHLKAVQEIHRGIVDAYTERMREKKGIPSIDLADEILNILNGNYSVMKADFFEGNKLEDEFCKRTFDLKSVIE